MQPGLSARLRAIRLRPLALCLGTALAATVASSALAHVPPAIWTVNTCRDDNSGDLSRHTGSLRFAVANARGGSTIDLSRLPTTYHCSVITLGTGSVKSGLAISQNDLTLQGPASGGVTITSRHSGADDVSNTPARLIDHEGAGTLSINDLTLESGASFDVARPERGGCVYSRGRVSLSHSAVCGAAIFSPALAHRSATAAARDDSTLGIATPEAPYLQSPPVDGD